MCSTVDRRQFMPSAPLGLAGLPFVDARALAAGRRSRVAIVRTTDRAQGVSKALALFGIPSPAGRQVVITPNFNSADDTPASTHNDTLIQLVKELKVQV